MLDTTWLIRNKRLDIPETQDKIKYYWKEIVNEMVPNDISSIIIKWCIDPLSSETRNLLEKI